MARSARRPADEATNPKTGPAPQAGVPTTNVNATRDSRLGPTPKRPLSHVENSTTRRLRRAGRLVS